MTQRNEPLGPEPSVRRPAPGVEAAAIGSIAIRHGPWLLQWFRRRTDPEDAEDLTQEALLSLVRHRATLERPERSAAYLLTAARRLLRDHIERRRRRPGVSIVETDVPSPDPPPEPFLGDALHRALDALPDELEQAVLAYYSREVTYEECAAALGVSRSLLQSRLRRARELLRRRLRENTVPALPRASRTSTSTPEPGS